MNEKECREIYREAFGEHEHVFENKLFSLCGQYCRTEEIDGQTVSMLFALPCKIDFGQKTENGYYIYAVATKGEHRGKGYMRRLFDKLKAEGKPLFLKPRNKGLIDFYEILELRRFNICSRNLKGCKAMPIGGFAELVFAEKEENPIDCIAMCHGVESERIDGMYFPFIME